MENPDLREGAEFAATVVFVLVKGLKDCLDAPKVPNALRALNEAIRDIDPHAFVLSALAGVIVVVPDTVSWSADDTLTALDRAKVGFALRVGVTHGTVEVVKDIDDEPNLIGLPINCAARLATSRDNSGVLIHESYAEFVDGTLGLTHWLHRSVRKAIAIAGKPQDPVFTCFEGPHSFDAKPLEREDAYPSRPATLVAYDLPNFSAGDRAQLRKRFTRLTYVFQKLRQSASMQVATALLSPGGDGGVLVLEGVPPADVAAIALRLQALTEIESLDHDEAIAVETRIGVHYGPVVYYMNARGIERPTGLAVFVADEIAGDEHARSRKGIALTRLLADSLAGGGSQRLASEFEQLPKLTSGPANGVERFVKMNQMPAALARRSAVPGEHSDSASRGTAIGQNDHRERYLNAVKQRFLRTSALVTIPGAGTSPAAWLPDVVIPRSLLSETESQTLLGWLRSRDGSRYVILAEVGSGKSVLLLETQHLAAIEAEEDPHAPLPLLARARDLCAPDPALAIARSLQLPVDVLQALIHDPANRWFLLVDGADEVAGGAWSKIEDFANMLHTQTLLAGAAVTARPVATPEQVNYRRLQFEPWTITVLDSFLERWKHVRPAAVASLVNSKHYNTLRHTLLLNPLMATLCLLLAENNRDIPIDRTAVFADVMDLLFEGWRNVNREFPIIEWRRLAPVLGQLALHYLKAGAPGLSIRDLRSAIRTAGFDSVLGVTDETERELGILVRRLDGGYDFVFRSFAEHLAALHSNQCKESNMSLAYMGWSEEVVRHKVGLRALQSVEIGGVAMQDRKSATAAVKDLMVPLASAAASEEALHLRPFLIALRIALDLEDIDADVIGALAVAAARVVSDEYSCWVGGRVADELRQHARFRSSLWQRCFDDIEPHIADQGALFRWFHTGAQRGDAELMLALRHCDTGVRSSALSRLSQQTVHRFPMIFVQELFDIGREMGTGLPPPAVVAAFRLRTLPRDVLPGLVEFLNRLLELDAQLVSGAAAVALRPEEAAPHRLVSALKSLASGYQIPQEPVTELEATEAGRQALREVWSDRETQMYSAYLLSGTSPSVRPLSTSAAARVIECLENGLQSLSDELLRKVLRGKMPARDVAACNALLAGDLRLLDEAVFALCDLAAPAQRILGRAALAHAPVARALLDAWKLVRPQPARAASFPGLALEPLVLGENIEAMVSYAQWIESALSNAGVVWGRPDPRVFEILNVRQAAYRAVDRIIAMVTQGEAGPDGRQVRYSIGAVAGGLNGLLPVWSSDPRVRQIVEEWLTHEDVNDSFHALQCLDRVPLDPVTADRLAGEVIRKLRAYLARTPGRYAYEALAGVRWLERNQLSSRSDAVEALYATLDDARVRVAATAALLPLVPPGEAERLSCAVAEHAVGLNAEHVTDSELDRLIGCAPAVWGSAVVSVVGRTFCPNPDAFRILRALPPPHQLTAARAMHRQLSGWELPWIGDVSVPLGRPADLLRMILFHAGSDLRDVERGV
jgi:class 3 adenylate cyclase